MDIDLCILHFHEYIFHKTHKNNVASELTQPDQDKSDTRRSCQFLKSQTQTHHRVSSHHLPCFPQALPSKSLLRHHTVNILSRNANTLLSGSVFGRFYLQTATSKWSNTCSFWIDTNLKRPKPVHALELCAVVLDSTLYRIVSIYIVHFIRMENRPDLTLTILF